MTTAPATQSQVADLQKQTHILTRLLDVSLVLNSNFELEPLLKYILDAASEITHSQSASILLIDKRTNELYFIASNTTDQDRMSHIPVPLDNSIAGTIVTENRSIVIHDASKDPRINRTVDEETAFQTRSLMGVPMRIKTDVIGALEVVNSIGTPWTEADREHLSILAAQAAVAIENAQQAEALKHAYEELGKLDKLKNDFIAIASHELRTPLSIIVGYAGFLQEEAEGAANEHATAVLNGAQRLGDIIEDMTNLRYLQMSASEMDMQPTPLVTLLHDAQKEAEPLASAKTQILQVAYPPLSVQVHADSPKLLMAITNVLNNAVKFTPPSGLIKMRAEPHGHEAWIRIEDSGPGIPADKLEEIFKEFYQIADHMTRKYNGLGLGLSIARAAVEAHGGRIWAESEGVNKGTIFTISLPLIGGEKAKTGEFRKPGTGRLTLH